MNNSGLDGSMEIFKKINVKGLYTYKYLINFCRLF